MIHLTILTKKYIFIIVKHFRFLLRQSPWRLFKKPIHCFHSLPTKQQLSVCSYFRKCCFSCLTIARLEQKAERADFSKTKWWKHGFPLYHRGRGEWVHSHQAANRLRLCQALISPFPPLRPFHYPSHHLTQSSSPVLKLWTILMKDLNYCCKIHNYSPSKKSTFVQPLERFAQLWYWMKIVLLGLSWIYVEMN